MHFLLLRSFISHQRLSVFSHVRRDVDETSVGDVSLALSSGSASLPRYIPVRERPRSFSESPATVLLMMREEHQPSSVRRRPRRFVFADLPSWFFLPRYLRLPDICTRRCEAEPRPSEKEQENGKAHLYAAPFVPGRMRGECSSRRDSATRFTDSMKTYLSFVSLAFLFSSSPSHSLFLSRRIE